MLDEYVQEILLQGQVLLLWMGFLLSQSWLAGGRWAGLCCFWCCNPVKMWLNPSCVWSLEITTGEWEHRRRGSLHMMVSFCAVGLKVLKSRHKSLSLKTSKRFEHWKTWKLDRYFWLFKYISASFFLSSEICLCSFTPAITGYVTPPGKRKRQHLISGAETACALKSS